MTDININDIVSWEQNLSYNHFQRKEKNMLCIVFLDGITFLRAFMFYSKLLFKKSVFKL
eukprot:UN28280